MTIAFNIAFFSATIVSAVSVLGGLTYLFSDIQPNTSLGEKMGTFCMYSFIAAALFWILWIILGGLLYALEQQAHSVLGVMVTIPTAALVLAGGFFVVAQAHKKTRDDADSGVVFIVLIGFLVIGFGLFMYFLFSGTLMEGLREMAKQIT